MIRLTGITQNMTTIQSSGPAEASKLLEYYYFIYYKDNL